MLSSTHCFSRNFLQLGWRRAKRLTFTSILAYVIIASIQNRTPLSKSEFYMQSEMGSDTYIYLCNQNSSHSLFRSFLSVLSKKLKFSIYIICAIFCRIFKARYKKNCFHFESYHELSKNPYECFIV